MSSNYSHDFFLSFMSFTPTIIIYFMYLPYKVSKLTQSPCTHQSLYSLQETPCKNPTTSPLQRPCNGAPHPLIRMHVCMCLCMSNVQEEGEVVLSTLGLSTRVINDGLNTHNTHTSPPSLRHRQRDAHTHTHSHMHNLSFMMKYLFLHASVQTALVWSTRSASCSRV